MEELTNWVVTGIAIVGIVLNIKKRWQGFGCCFISNAYWCGHNCHIGEYAQAILFAAFWLLAVYGIYIWRKPKTPEAKPTKQLRVTNLHTTIVREAIKLLKTNRHQ